MNTEVLEITVNEYGIYGYSTMKGVSLEQWHMIFGKSLPDNHVITIDNTHHLYNEVLNTRNFKPVIKNDELVAVNEHEPIQIERNDMQKLDREIRNLHNSEEPIFTAIEAILPNLYDFLGIAMPPEVSQAIYKRKEIREKIDMLDSQIKLAAAKHE
jgi:Rad3-related DNA helicase